MTKQLERLIDTLTKLADGGLCVAFSGGVDSALLLKAACSVTKNVHAVTLYTPFHSPLEPTEAARMAQEWGAVHSVITLEAMPAEVLANPPDRCYLCKRSIFTEIRRYADRHGLAHVLDGTNADDLNEYRPGLRTLVELGVISPLAGLGLSKAEVRTLAAELGLAVAAKPSAPCLATRFPYNEPLHADKLAAVDEIERFVKALGPQVVRARVHGDTIRLEVLPEEFGTVAAQGEALVREAQARGFARITLDLAGYRSGSFDGPYRKS